MPMFMRSTIAGIQFLEVRIDDAARMIGEMSQYSEDDRGKLPRFILKRRTGKVYVYTVESAIEQWSQLTRQQEDFVLQPYLVCSGHKAKMVRVTWTQLVGAKAKLFSNEQKFIRPIEDDFPLKKGPKHSENVDERYLAITPFAQETDCVISQTTAHLAATTDYVRLILEQTVMQAYNCRINSLSVDLLPDLHSKWFFLCIDSYQLGVLKKTSSTSAFATLKHTSAPSVVHSRLMSRRSDRNGIELPDASGPLDSHRGSATSSRATSSQLPFRGLRLQRKSDLVKAKLADNMNGLTRTATEDSSLTRNPSARWAKTLALEDAISDMIQQKAFRPISHITYRKWKERTDKDPVLSNIDLLYAQKLAAKEKESRQESEMKMKDLVAMKNEIIKITAVSALGPDTVNPQMGRVLLERIKVSKDLTGAFFPSKAGSKARGGKMAQYKAMRMQQTGVDKARETLSQVSRRMDEMQRVAKSRLEL